MDFVIAYPLPKEALVTIFTFLAEEAEAGQRPTVRSPHEMYGQDAVTFSGFKEGKVTVNFDGENAHRFEALRSRLLQSGKFLIAFEDYWGGDMHLGGMF